jgi:15-cis-phytoene synthase
MTQAHDLAALCRVHDYERYVCSLFAPKTYQPSLWAVLALAHEWSRIPLEVHEEMIALVKLKWWQEQCQHIGQGEGKALPPLLQELAPLMQQSPALVSAMQDMLDALAETVHGGTHEPICATMSALYCMLAHTAIQSASEKAYRSIGEAYGTIAWIRSQARREQQMPDEVHDLDEVCARMVRPHDAFGARLYRLNRLWQKRIHHAMQHKNPEKMRMIPLLALRLVV